MDQAGLAFVAGGPNENSAHGANRLCGDGSYVVFGTGSRVNVAIQRMEGHITVDALGKVEIDVWMCGDYGFCILGTFATHL